MKSAALQMARAIRVTCVLAAIVGVAVFSLSLSSQANLGRTLRVVIDQTARVPSRTTGTIMDKDRAVGLLTPPEEETWERVESW
jgi:hypothetical protein